MMKTIKNNLTVIGLYLLMIVFFLRGIIFSPGMISGGDWGLPFTLSQMDRYFKSGFYTWTDRELFGTQQFFLNSLPFQILTFLVAKIGITGEVFTKLLLILAFVFPAFTMYLLCRFLNCDRKVAFFGGFLYITLPFFFNYAAMGWLFVLFSMGILPLVLIFFIKSVKEEKIVYSILTGFLYFLAMIQSQSLVWYPLVFLCLIIFLVEDRKSLFSYIKSFLVVFLVFFGLNVYLWLPLFFGGGSGVIGTKLGLSTVSLGTWARLSYLNILRLWGSLFNYQYETSYPQILTPLSFLLPILAYSSLIFVRKKKILLSLAILSFVPLILFTLGPNFIVKLPFSDIFRDIARFLVLSSFSFVVMMALFLDFLFKQKKKYLNLAGVGLVILLIINTYSFWAGELFGEQKQEYDVRLRTYNFSPGDFALENSLREEQKDTKVMYLPIGSGLVVVDDKRFNGAFKVIRDIFASYSPKPGLIGISDRGVGSATGLIFGLKGCIDNQRLDGLSNLLSLMDVKYVAVRENVSHPLGVPGKEVTTLLSRQPGMALGEKWDKISLLENNNFLPHFYIPQNIFYSNGDIESLGDIVSFGDWKIGSGVYLDENGNLLDRVDEVFVKADLENPVDEKYFEKMETFKNSVPFPYVRHKPGSLFYSLVLKREQFEEWKVRKNPEKLIDKKLFYAGKRIAEIGKFTDNRDEALVLQIGKKYQAKMEEVIKEVEKLENQESKKDWVIKIRAYLEKHKERLEKIDKLKPLEEIFTSLDKKISLLEEKSDLQTLNYNFEISREGNYKLLVKSDELEEIGKMKLTIDDEVVTTDEAKLRNDGWIDFGERNFDQGVHKLSLHLAELKNLVDDNWQESKKIIKKDKGIEFFSQGFSPNTKNLVFQEINNWQPNNLYYLSFDYKTEGDNLGMGILESKIERQEENKTVKKEEVLGKILRSGKDDQWKKFETVLRTDGDALGAEIYFYAPAGSDASGKVEFKNLKIQKIVQPKIALKNIKPQTSNLKPQTPKITFVKINPTKYRVKVEGAVDPYTLVFSESFHKGWKLYINELKNYGGIVASYFNGDIKEGTHKNIFLDRNTFETWNKKSIPEERHLLVNGYANSWYITPEDVGGKQDYEIIIEFWPQRLFYIGLFISGLTLFFCLGYLGYSFARKKLVIGNEEN